MQNRSGIASTTLLMFFLTLLGIAPSTATTPAPSTIVTFESLPIIRADAIPVVAGHKWRATSNSNKTLSRCLTTHGVAGGFRLRTQQYVNDLAKSNASISYAEKLTVRPTDLANWLQRCLNSVRDPHPAGGMGPDGHANAGINSGVRSYAFAYLYQGLMFMTYWAQPGAPVQEQSPAVVMTARVLVMNQLAAKGITNPDVVKCTVPGSGKTTPLPAVVRAMILKSFTKLAPVVVSNKQVWLVSTRGQSSTPHVCLWPWGFPEAWSGWVPRNAIRALEVAVKHSPEPASGDSYSFVTFALMPVTGWRQIGTSSSP